MLDNIEFILEILFFVLSIIWAGRILILRSDKQIVINPLLILLAAILVILPDSNMNLEIIGISVENIRIGLYCIYIVVTMFGIYSTNQSNSIF